MNDIISKLDKNLDAFLIYLLNDKLKQNKEKELSLEYSSEQDILGTKKGVKIYLKNRIKKYDKTYLKIQSIIDRFRCEDCVYSTFYKKNQIFCGTRNNKICDSCIRRTNILESEIELINEKYLKKIDKIINDKKDIILLKSICYKIKKRRKNKLLTLKK